MRRREGKQNGKKPERETNHESLWTENKLRVTEGREERGSGSWVMGIKEGMCGDGHRVLYATNELLNTRSKANDVLHVS